MSLNPIYLWNPQNFPDQQVMLPDGFDATHRIVSEWADQPLPQGADTSAFDKLAGYIAETARSGKTSADFKAAYSNPNIHEPPAMTVSPSQAPDQTEQGSRKAAARLAEYYQFAAYGLPDPPENEREAKAEHWQKRAQEAQAK